MRYAIWNDFVAIQVEEIQQPETAEQVSEAIQRARERRKHIKAVGAGHSFNDLGMCEDVLIDIRKLNRVLAVDLERRRVRVQAGIRLKDLVVVLEQLGLALPNIGAWTEQTLAGVLSTATHGTSGRYRKTLIEGATEVRLIDGRAQERVLRGEALSVLTLGFFGVITEVELQCEPLFYLRQSNQRMEGDRAIAELETQLSAHDFVDMRWAGSVSNVILRRWDIVPRAPRAHDRAVRHYEASKLAALNAFLSVVRTSVLPKRIARPLFQGLAQAYIQTGEGFANTAVWHQALTFNSLGLAAPHDEREFAVPRAKSVECLRDVRKQLLASPGSASLEIQVRFSPPVPMLMAPNYGQETMWFNLNILDLTLSRDVVTQASETVYAYGARPHWAKTIPGRTPKLSELYGDDALRWEALRRAYDPDGLFLNAWYHRHIGLAPASLPEQEERDARPEPMARAPLRSRR